MKFFKNIIIALTLLSISLINPRDVRQKGTVTPVNTQQPVQPLPKSIPINKPAVNIPPKVSNVKQQPVVQPVPQKQRSVQTQSFAQALNAIRTSMPSQTIIKNNVLTPEFINFVQSLNLSALESTALLQAGAHIHATWTGNDQQDKNTVISLQNNIKSITQKNFKPTTPQKVTPISQPSTPTSQPTKPRQKQTRDLPKKPVTPITPIAQNKPTQQIPQQQPTVKSFPTNDVIMILDPSREESIEKRVGAMVTCATQAIYEKAAPIIMTSNVLEIITTVLQQISPNELQQLRTINPNQIESFANQLLQKYNLTRFRNIELILLSVSNFDINTFNCYLHKSANIVLLIPKQYITKNLPNASSVNTSDQARACGFNPSIITALNDLTPSTLLTQLQNQPVVANQEQFITNLTSLFIPQKRNGQLISPQQDTKWVIYLTGHGASAHQTIGTIREQLKINKHNLTVLQSGRAVIHKNNPNALAIAQANIKKYEPMLEGKSDWPNSQLMPESGHVAGLEMKNFATLMNFFDTIIDTAFLHYSTCFAGGYNQSFVNEILSSLNVNFIVSAEGIHEASVIRQIGIITSSQQPHIRLANNSFTNFFNLTNLFISDPEKFVKNKQARKEPVAQILRTIVPNMVEGNQPFVRFPGAGVFSALSLGNSTKVLTQVMVKAHEIEKKPIIVNTNDINIIVVNPSRINVPLILGKNIHCAIASPTPTTITPGYEAINTFKEINIESSMQLLIYNFIHLNARLHTQTFIVDKLTGIMLKESGLPHNSGTITNLIIQMKGLSGSNNAASNSPSAQLNLLTAQNLQYGKIGVNVQISFEFNGNIYESTLGIKNFEDPHLEQILKQITFSSQPATTANMNNIANKYLTAQEVNKLVKPITLSSIAKTLDSRIDQQESFMDQDSPKADKALLDFTKRKQK